VQKWPHSVNKDDYITFFDSLPNMSKQVRWSLDLRWQKPDLPFGFYGMKQGIPMRYENDPNYVINWEEFDAIDRHELQRDKVKDILQVC